MRLPESERAVARDEESMHMIDRQRVQQHVAAREAPVIDQRQRVAREIAMRQHRAFGAAGRARRVEDRRQVVRQRRRRYRSPRPRRKRGRAGCRFSPARREHRRLGRSATNRRRVLGRADDHARFGVAEEISEFALLVAGVQRQIDKTCAQACEIQRKCLPALLDLHCDAIAGHAARAASACAMRADVASSSS